MLRATLGKARTEPGRADAGSTQRERNGPDHVVAPFPAKTPTRRIDAMARNYWRKRYLDAMTKAEQARDPEQRKNYIELAGHYLTMETLIGKSDASDTGDVES
jgi:hypothetical protein